MRLAAGTAFPAAWIAKQESAGDWDVYETRPVSVAEMHAFAAGKQGAFIAGIQQA